MRTCPCKDRRTSQDLLLLRKSVLAMLRQAAAGRITIADLAWRATQLELMVVLLDPGWPEAPRDPDLLRVLERIKVIADDPETEAYYMTHRTEIRDIEALLEKGGEEVNRREPDPDLLEVRAGSNPMQNDE